MTQFHSDTDAFMQQFFDTWPYAGLRRAIDVYRIDVTSTDSGADDPKTAMNSSGVLQDCSAGTPTGASPRTYFDSTFCSNGIPRLLSANADTVVAVANQELPAGWDAVIVLVNTTR